jgi:hypothetical protein
MNSKPFSALDPLDVGVRIDELKLLKTGWLDGKGLAPSHDGLQWLAEAFNMHFSDDLPLPHLYPTPEGGIRAEWSIKSHDLSLEIDFTTHIGAWHSFNLGNDTEQIRNLKMDDPKDWNWLRVEIHRLTEANA